MQKIICYTLIILGVLALFVIAEMIREYHTFRVTNYNIYSDKLSGIPGEKSIVFLSDLHNRVYGKNNSSVVTAIRKANPDLILIGGDMLVGKPDVSWSAASNLIKQLPEICPVYYANGNHEYRMKIYPDTYGTAYEEYKAALEECGVQFLENESAQMKFDDCSICISGLEIEKRFYRKFHREYMSPADVTECIGCPDASFFQILMAHNPTHFKAYKEWGADLVVSGHFHGGVVRIPGIGGVISTQLELFPKYSGELTKEDNTYIAVSKGLGTHSVNFRLFNLPEIVVLHLKACENMENQV